MPSYVLRDYQKECVDLVNGLPDGCRTVVALATGLGKTLVGASLEFKGRVLWLSHRDELVRQPEKYFRARGMSFGIEKADEHADGEDVISASVQSLYHDSRLESFPKDAFDTIIVDEAHHAAAPTYKKILSYFTPRKVIGLTATPGRGDGVRLTDVFDNICFSRNIAWGITHGYLADIRCLRVSGGFDLSGVDMSGGDYTAASLERAMDESENAETVACAYMDSCRPKQLRTLVYCPTRRICQEVADAIKKKIPDKEQETVRVLTGEDPADVRSQALADFRKGKARCLVNCMILTEGTDLPETRVIINDRPTANSSLYTQIVGRGTRLAEGKTDCLVIDIVGKDWKDKVLCTAPTLFGIDPDRLPARVRAQITDGKTDLSAAAEDAIDSMLPNLSAVLMKRLTVQAELVNIFTQEAVQTVEMAQTYGLSAAAGSIALQAESAGPDGFGDLYIHKTPYTDRAFRIDATYHDRIYISEPDMLDHAKITLDFRDGGRIYGVPERAVSPLMPRETAVSFVTDLLTCLPEEFMPLWSVSARKAWGRECATYGQQKYLSRLYGAAAREKTGSLSRIAASDLIDLALDADALKADKKRIDKEKTDAGKKRAGKVLVAWETKKRIEEERKQIRMKDAADAWTNWAEKDGLHARADKIRKDMAERRRQEEIQMARETGLLHQTQTLTVETADESRWTTSAPESDKQASFLDALLGDLEAKHVFLDDGEHSRTELPRFTSGQASLLIDLFLRIKNGGIPGIPAQSCAVSVDVKKLIADVQKLTGRGISSLTLSFVYLTADEAEVEQSRRRTREKEVREEAMRAYEEMQAREQKEREQEAARRDAFYEKSARECGYGKLVRAGVPLLAAERFIQNGKDSLLDVSRVMQFQARSFVLETKFPRHLWDQTRAALQSRGLKAGAYPLSPEEEKQMLDGVDPTDRPAALDREA